MSPLPEIVLGSPGCGKTTALIGEVERELAAGTPPDRIGYVSFTRRAAEEAVARACARFRLAPRQLPHFRTLHSLCFRALGLTSHDVLVGARVREFADLARIRFTGRRSEDGSLLGYEPGDRMLHLENLARVRCEPLRATYDGDPDSHVLGWREVERVAAALAQFKLAHGLLDFTDMLSQVLASPGVAPRLDVLVVDEGQDQSILQWRVVSALAARARRVVVGADDDQCHPPGILVLTSRGEVPIEQLMPSDRVVQYDRRSQSFRWNGYPYERARRAYRGAMYTVNGLPCTPDHKFTIQWGRKKGFITYLMRRGEDVRVGWCQMFNSQNVFHAEPRRRLEKADALWVLRWHTTKQEASFYEQEVSVRYGVPTAMFREVPGNLIYKQDALDTFFKKVRGRARWETCLRDHARDPRYPLLDSSGFNRRRTTLCDVRALNIIPEVCDVPVRDGRGIRWVPAEVSVRPYDGYVYSLDAPPHRYYVANGVVTHNCIFRWAGASAEALVDMEGQVRVLGQSYRVPAVVQVLAAEVISAVRHRRPKTWAPRGAAGTLDRAVDLGDVDWGAQWVDEAQPGGEVARRQPLLVLARNTYVLRDQVEPELRRAGVLYEWADRPSLDPGLVDAVVSWEHLRSGGSVTAAAVRGVYALMTPGRGVSPGHRDLPGVPDDAPLRIDDLERQHGLLTRALWSEALDRVRPADVDYVVAARQRGERLRSPPRVRLSTVHAAKGGEARHVVLMREMARRTHDEMLASADGEDDERRVWYVAVTRARERLTVVEPTRAEACPWV